MGDYLTMTGEVFKIASVSYTYPSFEKYPKNALNKISADIKPDEITALLGPTGSGKSTLLSLLAGLVYPDSGSVLVKKGKNYISAGKMEPGYACTVFQFPEHQFFAETVFKEVTFGPENLRLNPEKIKSRVIEALNDVELPAEEFGNRSPFELSAGQKRRLAIASVLSLKPSVLLFDEPTIGLDCTGIQKIEKIIRTLSQKGIPVIIASHNVDFIWSAADRILFLENGKLLFDRDVKSFFTDVDIMERTSLKQPELLNLAIKMKKNGINFNEFPRTEHEMKLIIKNNT